MDRIGWYEKVAERINDNLERFYSDMYKLSLQNVGANYRVEQCPKCTHKDCCTVSNSNALHCFSCGWRGTHINAYIDYVKSSGGSRSSAVSELEKWSGVIYPRGKNQAEIAASIHYARLQEIKDTAIQFFHKQLMECKEMYTVTVGGQLRRFTALEYQQQIRKHTVASLQAFKVMFAYDYKALWRELADAGYTKDEIKEAQVWFPEGTFVYPYFHPHTRDVIRFNVKNPFGSTIMNQKTNKEEVVQGYSTGTKILGFSPEFTFKKPIIVVEGENDAITIVDNGYGNVCWTGGNLKDDQINILDAAESIIYTAFDNDTPGEKYYELTQKKLPHKDVRKLDFGNVCSDIDDYYRYADDSVPIDKLMSEAKFVATEGFVTKRTGVNNWSIANRHRAIEFEITGRENKTNEVIGKIDYYTIDDTGVRRLDDRDVGKSLIKAKAKMKPFNFYLADEIETFFNENLDERTFPELIDIYFHSSHKAQIIRMIGQYLFRSAGTKDQEDMIDRLKRAFNADIVDTILKELNDIQNSSVLDHLDYIPKMKISQYFNVRNGDAYMYFTRDKRDGDVSRRIPFLLRNDGVSIRLDLLKRKDPQCLLLVDNKYELTSEVPGPIMKHEECSLWCTVVDKFADGKIDRSEINPGTLIQEIESWIKKFYYFKDVILYKILAIYIFGTYFYELFGVYPYLLLNGEKGSGKSTLDTVLYLLCFNAKHAINITDASLYRIVAVEGGTMILDEMENLTSRAKSADSVMASVLKGGYARAGSVYRYNTDTGLTDGYDPYGPKIISNIFGIEDVIGDRCIEVKTYRMKMEDDVRLEDPKLYASERLDILRTLTSKCCLSALTYFQLMYDIFESKDNKIKTHSPRSHQLVSPLLATARLVDAFITGKINDPDLKYGEIDGPYEKALTAFHDSVIIESRESADATTPEGIVKQVIINIAKELSGEISAPEDKQYTVYDNRKYTEPITYDAKEGWFEVNAIHIKCFLEESMPGDTIHNKYVTKWVRSVFPIAANNIRRRITTLENDDLIRESNGNKKIRVNYFRFYVDDILYGNNFMTNAEDDDTIDDDVDARLF